LYKEYESGWTAGKVAVDELKKQEFSKGIALLKEMVGEANDMEEEAPE
jgi:hypothetical protein